MTADRSERSSVVSMNSDWDSQMAEEGISFYDYVVQTCGPDAPQNFSDKVNLHSIRVICLLGEGSFAKVFFVKKMEKSGQS